MSFILTPDFHKGSGIPVGTVVDAQGFVIPQAIGNDICCGMRLSVTDLTQDELLANENRLKNNFEQFSFKASVNYLVISSTPSIA
ncbi:MAG: RtcB family protein [Blastocatellia bacterium]|nr:RtcB family protein [Blastocatellia bacterium]